MGVAVYRARHGLICHEEQDETIAASLRIYGEWAEEEIYFLSTLIEPGAVVLDAGAHVGTHALAFARFVGSRGRVIAIEAQERMHALLTVNVSLNDFGQVTPIRALVGQETGLRFVPPESDRGKKNFGAVSYANLPARVESQSSLLPLAMIKLDDLSLERCDLMKIDVETMEFDVLVGAAATIARHRPPIYFEQARAERFAEKYDLFHRADYSIHWHVADPFNRNNYRGHAENIFGGTREHNVLAIPNEKAERYRDQTSPLQPISGPSYEPPPWQGPTTGWSLPETAYQDLDPVVHSALGNFIPEKI